MISSSTAKARRVPYRTALKGGANIVFFDGITAGEKDFSALIARLQKENIDFVYYGGYYPEMGQMLRQARATGLKTQFMGPEGVGNASLSNIAGDSAEGMLVTMPKRYDRDPANKAIVDALKAQKKDPSGPYVWDHLRGRAVSGHRAGPYRQ